MIMPATIEQCHLINFRKIPEIPANCTRIYFGHETCEKCLPAFDEIQDLLEAAEKRQIKLTYVTPFLSEKGLEDVQLFLFRLQSIRLTAFEITSSDWGLLHWIKQNNVGTPVVSRFLTGQQVDFRLSELRFMEEPPQSKESVIFFEGKYQQLNRKRLSQAMIDHLSSCTLMKEKTIEIFIKSGITRFELSNVIQPVTLASNPQCHYSLHTPFVPLTIFRSCPEDLDFKHIKKACNAHNCNHSFQKWQSNNARYDLYRIDNALFYYHPDIEPAIFQNTRIDRIVYNDLKLAQRYE